MRLDDAGAINTNFCFPNVSPLRVAYLFQRAGKTEWLRVDSYHGEAALLLAALSGWLVGLINDYPSLPVWSGPNHNNNCNKNLCFSADYSSRTMWSGENGFTRSSPLGAGCDCCGDFLHSLLINRHRHRRGLYRGTEYSVLTSEPR